MRERDIERVDGLVTWRESLSEGVRGQRERESKRGGERATKGEGERERARECKMGEERKAR